MRKEKLCEIIPPNVNHDTFNKLVYCSYTTAGWHPYLCTQKSYKYYKIAIINSIMYTIDTGGRLATIELKLAVAEWRPNLMQPMSLYGRMPIRIEGIEMQCPNMQRELVMPLKASEHSDADINNLYSREGIYI